MEIESVLNKPNSRATNMEGAPIDSTVLIELQSQKYLHHQSKVRSETDPDKQMALKANGSVFMISCQCKGTKKAIDIVSCTELIAIDIDFKDNLHITNYAELKAEICKIKNVAYCGLSIRGQGYFIIIPIEHTDKHQQHFEWLKMYFTAKGINIDPVCGNVNRLRYHSFDADAYYNHEAKRLQAYYVAPVVKPKQPYNKTFDGQDKPVWEQYNESLDFIVVLTSHGWTIESEKGNKIYFIRQGKTSGISAEFDKSKNVVFVFSSNAAPFEGWKGYNPFTIFTILEHSGDFTKAARALMPKNVFTKPYKAQQPVIHSLPTIHLSVKQLPIITARSAPMEMPVPIREPPPEPPANNHYTLQQLQAIALKQSVRIKTPLPIYLKAWAQSMAPVLQQSNITQQQILNSLN